VTDAGTWQAWVFVPDGVEHAQTIETDCTPEAAVEAAQARAVGKYGPQDWARWWMRAEWCSQPAVLRAVRLESRDGALHRRPEG
jgi:hypothetical protein